MKNKIFTFLLNCILLSFFIRAHEAKVDLKKLIDSMNNEDKCGQMTQVAFEVIEKSKKPILPEENPIDIKKLLIAIKEKKVGSILDTPYDIAQKASTWQKIIKTIQDVALNETLLKIPILYGIDSIHGATYIRESVLFPQPLAIGSTFNTNIAFQIGEIAAMETRACGIPWNFSPILDVGRQFLWPRLFETFGEDSYLVSRMGESYINGHQGDNNLKMNNKTATCLKHFIGYSYPFNGKDRTEAFIPENLLREVFLPSFQAGVLAGSLTVMINSALVNGLPGHANNYYINDILKGELNFTGFVVSDWQDIIRLYTRDKIAETPEDAVRIAVMAGVDMSMVPFDFSFYEHCVNLTQKDDLFSKRVDDAVNRILQVKERLGLFDNPYPSQEELRKIGTNESEEINLESARESIILSKNEKKILPLNITMLKENKFKMLVTGPTGNILRALNGGWSYTWQGNNEEAFHLFGRKKYTVYEAIKKHYSNVEFSEGANFDRLTDFETTLYLARKADYIILCIGEETYAESMGNINSLYLSDSQIKLANALLDLKKPTIVVYLGGRPRIISDIVNRSNAVVVGFLPGNRGAEAIADILFGHYNPNGKMPISYPKYPNGIATYDYKPLEEFDLNKVEFLFEFGHGLSYTEFLYESLKLNTTELTISDNLSVKVTVRNVGNLMGKEVIILYLNDVVACVSRPNKQMKRFTKIILNENETKEVEFILNKYDLSFINYDGKRIVEPGKFNIYIGNLTASFWLKKF